MRPDSFPLNPYEVLGVPNTATTAEIRAAYRQHALRWHPDHNPNDEYAIRMMQRVNSAWSILKDEHSRATYDRWQRGGTDTTKGPDAWVQPPPGPPPGREWYRPPPSTTSCPRCGVANEPDFQYCNSCGLILGAYHARPTSSAWHSAPRYNANTNWRSGLPADFLQRFAAYLIDVVCVWILMIALGVAFIAVAPQLTDPFGFTPFACMFLVSGPLYFTITVAAWSTTLGKRILGLRVVRNDGSKIGVCRAFARYFCYSISFLIFGIGFLMILYRPDKCGLHDVICDTKVVYR